MIQFIFLLLFFTTISSVDQVVRIHGAIDPTRFIVCSKYTITSDDYDVSTTGSDEFLLGSVEILLFSNEQDSGIVKMCNMQYYDSKFRALKGISDDINGNQLRVVVRTDTNPTTGAAEDPTILLTESAAVQILDPSTDTAGLTFTKKIILEFYTKDDTQNSLDDGEFTCHFKFYWEED